jgi:hypothetical protein
MSAFGGKADIGWTFRNNPKVRHFASIQLSSNREDRLFDTGRFKLPVLSSQAFWRSVVDRS